MFNPFNFGARPTPSSPKVFVLRTAARDVARVRDVVLHRQLDDSQTDCEHDAVTTRIRSMRRVAARSAASYAACTLPTLLHRL